MHTFHSNVCLGPLLIFAGMTYGFSRKIRAFPVRPIVPFHWAGQLGHGFHQWQANSTWLVTSLSPRRFYICPAFISSQDPGEGAEGFLWSRQELAVQAPPAFYTSLWPCAIPSASTSYHTEVTLAFSFGLSMRLVMYPPDSVHTYPTSSSILPSVLSTTISGIPTNGLQVPQAWEEEQRTFLHQDFWDKHQQCPHHCPWNHRNPSEGDEVQTGTIW